MLDIHPACDTERIELYRNVHDVWGRGLPMDEHVQRRLASPQHNRAMWFVGCTAGRVATSLGVYPLEFRYRGGIVPGMAIGAVHTHADFRGRGYAPELIRRVEHDCHRDFGTAISLLYSDIRPGYYARLGYVECPAWELDFDSAAVQTPDDAERCELHPIPLSDAAPLMSELYDAVHRELPIFIHRSSDYWHHLLQKAPHDEVFAIGPPRRPDGYVRIGRCNSSLIVRDFAIRHAADPSHPVVAVLRIARERRESHVTGWVPRPAGEYSHLAVRRTREITMLKPLSEEFPIDGPVLSAADWFHEIDHV